MEYTEDYPSSYESSRHRNTDPIDHNQIEEQIHTKQQLPQDDQEDENKIGCDWRNLFSISAIFRMFFLIFAIVGVISSAACQTQSDNGIFASYVAIRISYLIVSAIIFLVQLALFVLDIINAFNVPPLSNWPIIPIILVSDCLLFFGILVLSILMFYKAKDIFINLVTTPDGIFSPYYYFSVDALYVCSIVGYLMSMLYVEEIVYLCFQLLEKFIANKKEKKRSSLYGY